MLDSKLLRTATEQVAQGLAKRGYDLDVAKIQSLEETRKAIQIKTENLHLLLMLLKKSSIQLKKGS